MQGASGPLRPGPGRITPAGLCPRLSTMLRGRESRETRWGVPRTLWGWEAGSRVEMELNLGVAERRKAVGECAGYPQFFEKASTWKQSSRLNSEVAQRVRTRAARI